ncbi:MAG: hypothetical protein WCJ35_03320 [Planctomycetota bacterium]
MSTEIGKHGESVDIERRLAGLEQSNWRWRLSTLGLLGAWAVTLSCSRSDSGGYRAADAAEGGDRVTRTLRVNEIELVNLKGSTVGWINKGGEPSISLSSPVENTAGRASFNLMLGLLPTLCISGAAGDTMLSGGGVLMLDPRGQCSVGPSGLRLVSYEGVAGQKYKDHLDHNAEHTNATEAKQRFERGCELSGEAQAVEIFTTKSGAGSMSFQNGAGKPAVQIGVSGGGGGLVNVANEAGKSVVSIATCEGRGFVDVASGTGKPVVSILASEAGGGGIIVSNTFGKAVVDVQANKANEGAVYVNRLNGEMGNALVPRKD